MAKIITFTANLLAETTFRYDRWSPGKANRAIAESFQLGGKGINVSKMLNRLSAENVALCFPGGDHGPLCIRWMSENGLAFLGYTEGCETRSGLVVRSREAPETTFLGMESRVSETALRQAVDDLERMEGEIVFAVCGSIQNWEDASWEPLRAWIAKRQERVKLAVDTYGPSLLWLLDCNPDIVKFNRDELELLFEEDERSLPTEALLAQASARHPSPRWIVTDGGNPIWFKEPGQPARSLPPPVVECVSATGCGDVFFATVLDCVYNRAAVPIEEMVALAADYASRNAAMPGIAEFDL